MASIKFNYFKWEKYYLLLDTGSENLLRIKNLLKIIMNTVYQKKYIPLFGCTKCSRLDAKFLSWIKGLDSIFKEKTRKFQFLLISLLQEIWKIK